MEKVEVIDDNGNVLRIVSRKEAIEKNLKHKAAFVIVKNSNNEFYITQRKNTKRVYPSLWVTGAGGAVNAGESYEEAAHRELLEELGFDSDIIYLFDFDHTSDVNNYKAKVFVTTYDGEISIDSKESEQGKWVSEKELIEYMDKDLICPDTCLYIKEYLMKYARDKNN